MINNDYEKVCSSSTIYIVLFDIAFLITIGINSACFYFYWYLKKVITCVRFNINTQQQFIRHINGKYQRNKQKY